MAGTGIFYWNDKLPKTDPRQLTLTWKITGATACVASPVGAPTLATYTALTQPTIDGFLGTVSEFTAAQFDATSMGNDAFGVLVDMGGQVQQLVGFEIRCYSSTGGSTLVTRQALAGTLADSTLQTAIQLGAYGNLAFKVDFGNTPDFDGLTSGTIQATIYWIAK